MADLNGANSQKREKGLSAYLQNQFIIFCLVMVLGRVLLLRFVDDQGMGYLALPMELYLISVITIAIPMVKTISGLMKVRIKREQYKNALKLSRYGFAMLLVFAVGLGAVCILLSKELAHLFVSDLSWMAVGATGFAICFALLCAGTKGFLMGVATKPILLFGHSVELVILIAGMSVGSMKGLAYGEKVAALLKNENLKFSYGAMGVMAGLAVAQLADYLIWLGLYIVFRKAYAVKLREDFNRRTEDARSSVGMIVYNMVPVSVSALLVQSIIPVGQFFYMRHLDVEDTVEKGIAFWGCFYGKYLPLMMIPIVACAYYMNLHNNRVVSTYEREEGRQLRERAERGFIKVTTITATGAIFVALLGNAFAGTFYPGMNSTVLKTISSISVLIVCYGICYASHNLLQKLQYHGESVVILLAAWIVGVLSILLLVGKSAKGFNGVAIGMCIFYLVAGIGASVRIYPRIPVRINLVRCFAYPLLTAALSGLILLFLNKMLLEFAGAPATLFVCLILGYFVEIFMLMAFHVCSESQLRNIPGGFIIVNLGKMIGVI